MGEGPQGADAGAGMRPARLQGVNDDRGRDPQENRQRRRVHNESIARIPPQAENAERALIGAMLIDDEAVHSAQEIVKASDCYLTQNSKIFECIASLMQRETKADLVTVTEELRRRGWLDDVGGAYYLTELTAGVASTANVEYYARIVKEKSMLRQLITATAEIQQKAYDSAADAFDVLDDAEAQVLKIADAMMSGVATDIGSVLKDVLAYAETIHGTPGGVTGISSGFTQLDHFTGGWQNSDLIVIAARPSMGKTALSLALARNAALHPDNPIGVAYFTMEMSAAQCAQRLLTSEARVDAQALRTGRLHNDDWPRLARAAGRLGSAQFFIDDTPGLSVLELNARLRRLVREKKVKLAIVDYLQLMHGSNTNKQTSREQEISSISRGLKKTAKELNIPIIALAQLSRAVETRGGDKRPQLSDLRESGAIENDADVVGFIYRAERYGITVDENGNSTDGIAEIILGKQRSGPVGTVQLAFVNQYARFENLTTYYRPEGTPSKRPEPSPYDPDEYRRYNSQEEEPF